MKKLLLLSVAVLTLASCHHTTLEDKAQKIAEDYTERYCPTPEKDNQITDSVAFNLKTLTFCYYYTLTGKADNPEIIDKLKKQLNDTLLKELREDTSMKVFKDANYNFRYVFRSQSTGKILFERSYTAKNYK